MTAPLLDVRGLRTTFTSEGMSFAAVDGVSFTLEAGRTLGIVGESGCGKSVTALSVMGLVPKPPGRIDGGEILFEGVDLLKQDPAAMRELRGNRISMIFQEPMTSLNPAFTVGDQVAEVIVRHRNVSREHANRPGARDAEARAHPVARDALPRLSAPPLGRHAPARDDRDGARVRSGALIADEPTTALDVTIQAQILDLMRILREETGTAIILITHDLGVIAEVADDVAVMYAGRIVERAPVGALFAQPQHPYTIGLLGSIPQLHLEQDRLAAIEGPGAHAVASGERLPLPSALPVRDRPMPRRGPAADDHHAGPRRRLLARPAPAARMTPLLEVRDLVKHFPVRKGLFGRAGGAVRAVDGVSFDLAFGETLALVGESGCGKSTTGRLVLRLLEPTSGAVRFDGDDLFAGSDADMRASAGRCRSSSRTRSRRSIRG
jgi:ABC-type glutathione transport system ATPase component